MSITRANKDFAWVVLLFGLWASPISSVHAASLQDSIAAQVFYPDSLRVTIDADEFRWRKFRYEAEMRVAPIYLNGDDSKALKNPLYKILRICYVTFRSL
ncbi:hypothetical protein L0337_19505 [candidate division KSB1 bacterium]|nr:hypothetical protein [candidate division KSB1 bacterium]